MPATGIALGIVVALACYVLGMAALGAADPAIGLVSIAAEPAPVNVAGMILANLAALAGAAAAAVAARDGRSILAPLTSWLCSSAILMVLAADPNGTPADMLALLNVR